MNSERDDLGIYIPRRLSDLTPDEILAEIDRVREQRVAMLKDIASRTPRDKPKYEKAIDLTKMPREDALTILAVQMGITIDQLKRAIAKTNNLGQSNNNSV
jgi:hypothetical protein